MRFDQFGLILSSTILLRCIKCAFVILLYFISNSVKGQSPYESYICPYETNLDFTASEKAPKSHPSANSGTQLSYELEGDIELIQSITLDRINGDPHPVRLLIDWAPGIQGIVTVKVKYERFWIKCLVRILGECVGFGTESEGVKLLYTYTFNRTTQNPGGSITGETTFTSTSDDSERLFTFSYQPSQNFTKGVKIRYKNGRVNNGVPEVTETALTLNANGQHDPVAINYYTKDFNTIQSPSYTSQIEVLDVCDNWSAGPLLNFSYKPTCYLDNAANVSLVVNNPLQSHPGGYEVEANRDYPLTVNGITDLLSHYDWNVQDGGSDIVFDQSNFRLLKGLGSYVIYAVPKPRRDQCPSIEHITVKVFVGGSDIKLEDPNGCPIILPEDFATKFPQYRISANDVLFTHFKATVISKKSITIKPGLTLALGAELVLDRPLQPLAPGDPDLNKNFTEHVIYNEYGQILAHSRKYYDDAGRIEQEQYKNLVREVMMAHAYVNDAYGRSVVTTLSAPVDASTVTTTTNVCGDNEQIGENIKFDFKEGFITAASDGLAYRTKHFDINNNQIIEASPQPVSNSTEGTLGWYYSTNNGSASKAKMNEKFVPNTSYPYVRTLYHRDGSGKVKGVSRPGDAFRPGSGRLATTDYVAVPPEDPYVNDYFTMRKAALNLEPPASIENEFVRSVAVDENNSRSEAYTDKSGATIISLYYGDQAVPITKSYNFYDLAGRLRFAISPKGVKAFEDDIISFDKIEKTVYTYNCKGLLLSMSEADAGTASYLYRKDGKIRFSQNAEQADTKNGSESERYSYTNYDEVGRPMESGEYIVGAGGIKFDSQVMKDILEDITPSGGLSETSGEKTERVFTFYDLPDNSSDRSQRFTHNEVSHTKNKNVGTWYSYDEQGRIEWLIQDIKDFDKKTIDYRYGPTGAVQEVLYQKGKPDQFTHFYEYDADGRLHKVYTTTKLLDYNKQGEIVNRNDLTLQVTYHYYLHGPLKRIEYSNGLQGIDYVYTADGSLKSINDADQNRDPGKDGSNNFKADVFGMTLDYYSGDYLNANHTPSTASYVGADQFTGMIKSNRWHSPVGNHVSEGYRYTYDSRYQLKQSHWINTVPDIASAYAESIGDYDDRGGYDLNGNILSMNRKDNLGKDIAQFKYDYSAHTNKLNRIVSAKDDTALKIYTYNLLGQLTEQEDVSLSKKLKMQYDVTGKVVAIRNEEDILITTYEYDDRGFRVCKTSHDDEGELIKKTWFVRDVAGNITGVYDEDVDNHSFALIEQPIYASGRIGVYKPEYNLTFYELADHLGNVRAVIGKAISAEFLATMEFERADKEEDTLKGFAQLKRSVASADINYTNATGKVNEGEPDEETYTIAEPNEVMRMNNRPMGELKPDPIGVGKMLWVHPKDKISAEVFVKYAPFDKTKNDPVTSIAEYVATAFKATHLVVDGVSIFNGLNQAPSGVFAALGEVKADLPRAFLTYILYDRNMIPVLFDQIQVSKNAEIVGQSNHERLSFEINIEKEGFIYIYVSNQTDQDMDVYFDDLRIKHTYSDIVAGSDYYPFGLAINDRQITREKYLFGYQGQFSEKDEETGWNHFELRQYDPVVGRWISTDPAGQYWSPYLAMGNDPVNEVDPDGAYSRIGAWWRNGFTMDGVHHVEGDEWGYYKGNTTGSLSFECNCPYTNEILDRASQTYDQQVMNQMLAQMSTADRIIATRGGDGIEPSYPETMFMPLPKGAAALKATRALFVVQNAVKVPGYAKILTQYIVKTGKTLQGYVSKNFQNREKKLPQLDPNGKPITYKEYDVHPHTKGVNRGAERVVIGSDGSRYYTSDHYSTFNQF